MRGSGPGLPGSGKSVFLAEVVQRLAGSHSWYVPVPLDDVPGGGEQDILDAAQRQLDTILHDASINPGLIESLGRSLARSRRLMIVIDDIDRIGPALSSYERGIVVARLMSSAQQLDVPLLATARLGSVESIAGSVIELPPPSADFLHQRLEQASGIPAELEAPAGACADRSAGHPLHGGPGYRRGPPGRRASDCRVALQRG